MQTLVRDLNRLYRETPALHVFDTKQEGFEWVDASDKDASIVSFLRWGRDDDEPALVVCNFSSIPRENYRIGVPEGGRWTERLNTDSRDYGGSGVGNGGAVEAETVSWHGRPYSLNLTLPSLSTLMFTREP